MADETIGSLGLDISDTTQPLNELGRVIDAANQKILKLGQVMASLDAQGRIGSLAIKSFKDGIGEVTKVLTPLLATKKDVKIAITTDPNNALKVGDVLKEAANRFDASGKLIAKAGDTRFEVVGSTVKTIKEKIGQVTPEIEKLAASLTQLGTGKSFELKTLPTDILRNIASAKRTKLGPEDAAPSEIIGARKSIITFQQELAKLVSTGKHTEESLNETFRNIAKGNLKEIPLAVQGILVAFTDMISKIDAIGTSAKSAEGNIRQLVRADEAKKSLIGRRDVGPEFEKRHTAAQTVTANLADTLDIKNIDIKTNKEALNYVASIENTIRFFKSSELTLKQFQNTSASAFSETPVNKYSGAQAILFDKLLKVVDALKAVGGAATEFDIKLGAIAEKAQKERDFSKQFKGLVGPIPTGVDVGLEKQIQRDILGVGKESAKIKGIGFDLKELENIATQTATGIIADFDKIPITFEAIAKKTADVQQKLITLRNLQTKQAETVALQASRPQRIADVTAIAGSTFDISTQANVSEKEQIRLKSSIIDLINAYARLDNISLSRFITIINEASNTAINSFKGEEAALFNFARSTQERLNEAGNAYATLQAKKKEFSRAEQTAIGIAGQPTISPIVDEKKISSLETTYKNFVRSIASEQIKLQVNDKDLEHAYDLARKVTADLSHLTIPGLDPNIQKLAILFQGLIQNIKNFDKEHTEAFEKAKIETDKLTAAKQTLADQAKVQAALPGVFDQVRKTTEQIQGPVSPFARAGDRQRVEAQISNISTAVAQGKIAILDYVNTLNQIRNKDIVPPDANQDINQLRNNVYSLVTAMQTASDRGLNFHKTLINLQNVARLFVVSQLYVAFSQLRQSIGEAITVTNQLSIQIGQIQAITQNAIASTEVWAESLRRVSDASGQNITDVSIAAYAALSNQITTTKEDTEEFANIATELGRTVGATPIEAVNLLSSTINAFGKNASDARQLAAEFFKTVDIGKITVGDLNNILGRAGIAGAKLGVTTTEFGAALATLTINGLTTEDAITRLNNLFVKLINPTKEMTQLFKEFGTSPEQLIKVHGFAGALQQIEGAIKNGNAAIEDLFPEIRTLVGFLGLSGANAIKFSQAIDKISNSIGEYNEASRLTSKEASFGQNLREEFNKLQNIFNVDIAQGFLKGLANANTGIGGLAKRLTDLIDVTRLLFSAGQAAFLSFYALKGVSVVLAGVEASIVALAGATNKASVAAAALKVVLSSISYTAPIVAATAGFFGMLKVLELLEERSKKAFEAIGKAGEIKFNTSSLKASIDNAIKESTGSFENASSSLARAFEKAFARITAGYNITVAQMKVKTEGLIAETKSALDSLDHILTLTITAVQNIPRETTKALRDVITKQTEREEETLIKQIEGRASLLKTNQQANSEIQRQHGGPGFFGPDSSQLKNTEDMIGALDTVVDRFSKLREEAVLQKYSVTAATAEHEKLIDTLTRQQRLLEDLALEAATANTSAIPGGPVSVSGGIDFAAYAKADAVAKRIIRENAKFKEQLKEGLERSKKDQAPLLNLKDRSASLGKTITDFDLSKLANLAPITDNGKIIETVQQQQEKILAPIKNAGKEIIKEFDKLKVPFAKADFLPDYEQDIENLKKKLDSLDDSRRKFGLASLDLNQFEKDKKAFIDGVKEAADSVKIYDQSIQDLNRSIGETFGRIQQQISKLPSGVEGAKNIAPLERIGNKPLFTPSAKSISDEVHNLIDSLNELYKKGKEEPTRDSLLGLKESAEDSLKELDILEKKIEKVGGKNKQSIIDTGNLKELKAQLTETFEELNRIQDAFKGQEKLQGRKEKSTKTASEQEFEFLTRLSVILTTSDEDFRRFQSSASNYNEKVIATFQELTRQAKEATQALKEISLPKDVSLVQPQSPIGAVVPGTIVPGTETKIPEVSIKPEQLNSLIEALKSTRPENIKEPIKESMGGFIPRYSEGGMVNYYNTKYYDKGTFVPKGTDTVPAMLTPEEYVMPADKTKKYRVILDAMRAGTFDDDTALQNLLSHWNKDKGSSVGIANKDARKIENIVLSNVSGSQKLTDRLWSEKIRKNLIDAAVAQGYPTKGITSASVEAMVNNWKGTTPDIKLHQKQSYAEHFTSPIPALSKDTIGIGIQAGSLDMLGTLRHELEHIKQNLKPENIPEDQEFWNAIKTMSVEIPPSLGDLAHISHVFKKHMKKPLSAQIELAPGITHEADWMAKQADEHGFFKGKSMTELLATKSGQTYLKKLLDTYKNKDIKNSEIKGYATGGGVTGTDTVSARLTPGEYVMPVDPTRKYLKQLNAMRAGSFPSAIANRLSGGSATNLSFSPSNIKIGSRIEDAISKFVGLPIIEEEIGKALSYNLSGGSSGSSGGGVVGGSPELSFHMSEGGIVPNYNPNYNFSQVQTAGRGTRFYAEGGIVSKSDSYSNTMNINVTGDTRNTENIGRKIGRAIQREVKRGNVKLN